MTDPTSPAPNGIRLRQLPFAARITLALFLASVGVGYASAIVNLHFQTASPGEVVPTPDDTTRAYHGLSKMSQLERLLTAHPSLPFNGQGSMRAVFSTRPGNVDTPARRLAKRAGKDYDKLTPEEQTPYKKEVLTGLEGERLALIAWIHAKLDKNAYDEDRFQLPPELQKTAITPDLVADDNGVRFAKVASIVNKRCVKCHRADAGGAASDYPLESFEQVADYTKPEKSTGMSLPKLALTTHVHLLGFAMLYGLTGLVLAFSSYPMPLRVVLCPLPLAAQLVDISFWWLSRLDAPHGPSFAIAINVSGAVVGGALMLQIILGVWDLFGRGGKFMLVLLMAAAAGGGYYVKMKILDPYLASEKQTGGELKTDGANKPLQ